MKALLRRFDHKGRARRREYWLALAVFALATFIAYKIARAYVRDLPSASFFFVMLSSLFAPFFALYITTALRRCQDIGIQGWYAWWSLFFGAGIPAILVLGCVRSDVARRFTPNNRTKFVFDRISWYMDTKRRATRREYWFFLVFGTLPFFLWTGISYGEQQGLISLGYLSHIDSWVKNYETSKWDKVSFLLWIVSFLLLFFAVPLGLFAGAITRRCNDIGISKWYGTIAFILLLRFWGIPIAIAIGCLRKDQGIDWNLPFSRKR